MIRVQQGVLLFLVSAGVMLQGREADPTNVVQVREGNFSLPSSQQPGSLVSFGQNIIDAHDLLGLLTLRRLRGGHEKTTQLSPCVLYGVTDRCSIFGVLPFELASADGHHHADLGDFSVQGEYAWYVKDTPTRVYQATVVATVKLPTGSVTPLPATGFGSPAFFVGATASYFSTSWLGYTGYGITKAFARHGRRVGNEFTYQVGTGRCIASRTNEWIITGLLELSGDYDCHNHVCHRLDCNSGSNTIMLVPSVWISTRRFSAQIGCGVVVYEHLLGVQPKKRWLLAADFAWKFNG